MEFYVSKDGQDAWDGSFDFPVKTLTRVQSLIRELKKSSREDVVVKIESGRYYLDKPLRLTPEDGGKGHQMVTYEGIGEVFLSGAAVLAVSWKPYGDQGFVSRVIPGMSIDALFINGHRKIMARYPCYSETARYFHGYARDSFDRERTMKYHDPKGGFMHVMHEGLWGDFHYRMTGKKEDGTLIYEGGWQNNRPSEMHGEIRYVENVFEELDSPGEWFLDVSKGLLYYIPEDKSELNNAVVEGTVLKNLLSLEGSEKNPVKNLRFKNITFTQSQRTFMEQMEPVLRSDWCICRNGAVLLEGTENVAFHGCRWTELGGNGIVISKYNRDVRIEECVIEDSGASPVIFFGSLRAARSPLFGYGSFHENHQIEDMEKGPKTNDYPRDCLVRDCLLTRGGRVEKQSAGISLSLCSRITIAHNTIYHMPRAGINICDGTWGGHEIVDNVVFDTVLETSDHGAFNSWGRDRYWSCRYEEMEKLLRQTPDLPLRDATDPTLICHNVFSCGNGWDIDLDDGSSNYVIRNNLCMKGGIKAREGVKRIIRNNILLNNTFHPHMWFSDSGDEFCGNIVFRPYEELGLRGWGSSFDNNILFHKTEKGSAEKLQKKSGMDGHSVMSPVSFKNMSRGDFRLTSPQMKRRTSRKSWDFRNCGVISPSLKKRAKSPFDQGCQIEEVQDKDEKIYEFEGLVMKRLQGTGEISATGMYRETGIYIQDMRENSAWHTKGIRTNDVLLSIDDVELTEPKQAIGRLKQPFQELMIWREQGKRILSQDLNS